MSHNNESCKCCEFAELYELHGEDHVECHKLPPSMESGSYTATWPWVGWDDWCGAFQWNGESAAKAEDLPTGAERVA